MNRYILALLITALASFPANAATTYFNLNAETGDLTQWFPDPGWPPGTLGGGDVDCSSTGGSGCGAYCGGGPQARNNEWVFAQSQIVHTGNHAYAVLLKDTSWQNTSKLETWQESASQVTEAWWSVWLYILEGEFQNQSYSFKSTQGINIIQWKSSVRADACPGQNQGPPLIVIEAYKASSDGLIHLRVIDWPYISCSSAPRGWSVPPNPDTAVPPNRWVNLQFHIKFSNDNMGFFQAWRDGVQIWNIQNINTAKTCVHGQPFGSIACNKTFFGVGMYAAPNDAAYQAAFFDDISMSDTAPASANLPNPPSGVRIVP